MEDRYMGCMALITALVLRARSQDSLRSVSVRWVPAVFSTAGFMRGGKPCPKTRKTTELRRGIQKASRNYPSLNPSQGCTSSRHYRLTYPSAQARRKHLG